MPKQHYDLFLQKLEVEEQIAALQQKQAALQQQIMDKHLEQEYAKFISCAWLPKEQQELVNYAAQIRRRLQAQLYCEQGKPLREEFFLLQLELQKQNLVDDFLYAWKLAELRR